MLNTNIYYFFDVVILMIYNYCYLCLVLKSNMKICVYNYLNVTLIKLPEVNSVDSVR